VARAPRSHRGGRWFESSRAQNMIQFYYRSIQNENLKRIRNFRNGCLIYCFEPDENDFFFLKENFNLDKNLLKDGLDQYEIPRVEQKNNKIYIFLRAPLLRVKEEAFTTTLLIIISDNFFMIFSKYKNKFINNFLSQQKREIITTQKTKLLIQLLSEIYEYFNKLILNINKKVRQIAFETNDINEKEIKKLIRLEIILQDFYDALISDNVMFNSILKQKYLKLFKEDKELIEDVFLKAEQLEDIVNTSLKNINNIRSGYESIFTNNVNKILKMLTFFTILLSIPTAITGFFGMNLKLPFESNPFAYIFVILFSFISMLILFIIFKIKKWL
jgi:magnesium transporter